MWFDVLPFCAATNRAPARLGTSSPSRRRFHDLFDTRRGDGDYALGSLYGPSRPDHSPGLAPRRRLGRSWGPATAAQKEG